MQRLTLHQIGRLIRDRRGDTGIRETAAQIGVSPATLSRVERGKLPDLETFSKVCRWLKIDPSEVLGVQGSKKRPRKDLPDTIQAHFRAERNLSPKAANALAELILATQKLLHEESAT